MNKMLGRSFQAALRLNAALTRHPRGRGVEQRLLTPLFVRLTRLLRGRAPGHVSDTPSALGAEWERLLGNRRYARVTRVDEESHTVYGEITGMCPLRGTGDVAACHRLMAYDRGLMAAHGAQFIVLSSQAEAGRTSCTIAMRPGGVDVRDLVPAHRRVTNGR